MAKYIRLLDDFVGNLLAERLAPGTVSNHVKGVKCLFRCSGLKLDLAFTLSKLAVYSDGASSPEELQGIIDMAAPAQRRIEATDAQRNPRIQRRKKYEFMLKQW